MERIVFTILGKPRPKQSVQFTKTGIAYQPTEVKLLQQNIRAQVVNQIPKNFVPWKGPLFVSCVYVFPFTTSLTKKLKKQVKKGKILYKDSRPDLTDNLNKPLFDAMNEIVFMDDSQICKFEAVKYYDEIPKILVTIQKLTDDARYNDTKNITNN